MEQTVKIFIASSVNEFRADRDALGLFISEINDKFRHRGIYCELKMCEKEDQAMSLLGRKQREYNKIIEECDAVFVLFHKKAGRDTLEELRHAHDSFMANGVKPKVYTYFKNFNKAKLVGSLRTAYNLITQEYEHFYGYFEDIATVKLDILRFLFEKATDAPVRFTEENGQITFDGVPVMNAAELDYIRNSKTIAELTDTIAHLKNSIYIAEATAAQIEKCESQLKDRYRDCIRALETRYKNMSDSSRFDFELQRAYDASSRGDYAQVMHILSLEKQAWETEKAVQEDRVNHAAYLSVQFPKLLQLIQAAQELKRYDDLEDAYDKAVDAIDRLHLYEIDVSCLGVWYTAVSFLYDQNKSPKAIQSGEKLGAVYHLLQDKVTAYDKAILFNLLGVLYDDQQNPVKTDEYYQKAIEIMETLAPKEPDRFAPDLATSYNNAGNFYTDQGNPEKTEEFYLKAEEFYLKAIDIRKPLAERNPDRFAPDLATSYFNYAILKNDDSYFQKAYEWAKKSSHSPYSRQIIDQLKDDFN